MACAIRWPNKYGISVSCVPEVMRQDQRRACGHFCYREPVRVRQLSQDVVHPDMICPDCLLDILSKFYKTQIDVHISAHFGVPIF